MSAGGNCVATSAAASMHSQEQEGLLGGGGLRRRSNGATTASSGLPTLLKAKYKSLKEKLQGQDTRCDDDKKDATAAAGAVAKSTTSSFAEPTAAAHSRLVEAPPACPARRHLER
eukprot:TRINITY_DN1978_c0_g2_i1.p2 TRINITY_DN1978_c0_g2~~TRINITY_DN1978_c0_g2_i1.p2  ORF type:complete len:115 (+),score=32.41 TRINITY_DN1978_c0_g2_i1:81-425(+)